MAAPISNVHSEGSLQAETPTRMSDIDGLLDEVKAAGPPTAESTGSTKGTILSCLDEAVSDVLNCRFPAGGVFDAPSPLRNDRWKNGSATALEPDDDELPTPDRPKRSITIPLTDSQAERLVRMKIVEAAEDSDVGDDLADHPEATEMDCDDELSQTVDRSMAIMPELKLPPGVFCRDESYVAADSKATDLGSSQGSRFDSPFCVTPPPSPASLSLPKAALEAGLQDGSFLDIPDYEDSRYDMLEGAVQAEGPSPRDGKRRERWWEDPVPVPLKRTKTSHFGCDSPADCRPADEAEDIPLTQPA